MSSQFSNTDKSSTPVAPHPLRIALSDAYRGFFAFTHNGMALVGVGLAALALTLAARADLRTAAEQQVLGWLLERHEVALSGSDEELSVDQTGQVLASEPSLLPKQQAAVTQWLSRKYRVAQEPLGTLVAEAFAVGEKVRLDPTLILAVMAIESRFNPYAQSPVGAQGLMQVLTRVHTDKYAEAGGHAAAFDPLTNLRVGVKVLQECIARAGSVEAGLKFYVGAANLESDGGYAAKVMAEHARLLSVVSGRAPAYMPTVRPPLAIPASLPANTGADDLPSGKASDKVASLASS